MCEDCMLAGIHTNICYIKTTLHIEEKTVKHFRHKTGDKSTQSLSTTVYNAVFFLLYFDSPRCPTLHIEERSEKPLRLRHLEGRGA
jgi:hypothetical protein